mmetsp:Transcript_17993/g.50498  ORF Transcript_17993/g.50498 Transcript_17993/m.50498 type:complete len:118 (-) Transcript_17993:1199-1552(-)
MNASPSPSLSMHPRCLCAGQACAIPMDRREEGGVAHADRRHGQERLHDPTYESRLTCCDLRELVNNTGGPAMARNTAADALPMWVARASSSLRIITPSHTGSRRFAVAELFRPWHVS